jgi:HAD superfamily hydrolase (TIGR01509 family)
MACFDIGGVLVKHCRTWREGCAAAGLPLHDGAESEQMSARRRDLAHQFTTGTITEPAFWAAMSGSTGGLYTPAQIERIHHAWLGPEYPDVGRVVRRLVDAGRVQTGVLSNTNAPHWARLHPVGNRPAEFPTASLLGVRLASHLIGHMKPHPETYVAFEHASGFAGPEILFLDDLPENLETARTRGWTCELIDHTRDTADQIETVLDRHNLI